MCVSPVVGTVLVPDRAVIANAGSLVHLAARHVRRFEAPATSSIPVLPNRTYRVNCD